MGEESPDGARSGQAGPRAPAAGGSASMASIPRSVVGEVAQVMEWVPFFFFPPLEIA